MGTTYLIHFAKPFYHAQHYIGWTENGYARMDRHREGKGSRLLKAVTEAGIEWEIVRTWPNTDRNFERSLKNQKNARAFCPKCKKAYTKRHNRNERRRVNAKLSSSAQRDHGQGNCRDQAGQIGPDRAGQAG